MERLGRGNRLAGAAGVGYGGCILPPPRSDCPRVTPARLFVLAALVGLRAPAAADDPAGLQFFEKQVRPVLVERCVKCHGPAKPSGGLRLDSREALLKGGDSGPAVLPGRPAESRLLKAVRRQ